MLTVWASFGFGFSGFFVGNRLIEAFEWILRHNYGITDILHYLDDIFTGVPPASTARRRKLHTISRVASSLGLPLAPEKTEGPATRLPFWAWNLTQGHTCPRTSSASPGNSSLCGGSAANAKSDTFCRQSANYPLRQKWFQHAGCSCGGSLTHLPRLPGRIIALP